MDNAPPHTRAMPHRLARCPRAVHTARRGRAGPRRGFVHNSTGHRAQISTNAYKRNENPLISTHKFSGRAILVAAVRRKETRHYRSILSSLMRYSILDRALKNKLDRLKILAGLFERLRHDTDVNREPLFWLQYSILMTAAGNYQAAEGFIRTAYERAAAIPKFRTFQIDTYALKLFLLIEREREDDPQVSRFEQIIEKLEAVRSMIWEESRRFHAIQVLDEIKPFVISRLCALSDEEKKTLNLHLQLLEKNLAQLPEIVRGETGSDLIRRNILHAMNLITTNDRL